MDSSIALDKRVRSEQLLFIRFIQRSVVPSSSAATAGLHQLGKSEVGVRIDRAYAAFLLVWAAPQELIIEAVVASRCCPETLSSREFR